MIKFECVGSKLFHSYVLYITTVLLATLFAGLAQIFSKKIKNKELPNKFFYLLTAATLIFIMGTRKYTVGVDGSTYLQIFNDVNSLSIAEYYQTKHIEPMYFLLNRLIGIFTEDFQWVLIITSIIIVIGFLKALAYNMHILSFPLAVFIFASTQYFYYFGIIRLGIAAAIIAFGYNYILEGKKKKFILLVVIATTFHYSALFALLLLLYKNEYDKKSITKMLLAILSAFLFVRFFVYPLIGGRYNLYIERAGFNIDLGFLTVLPFLLLALYFYKPLTRYSNIYHFFFVMFVARILTEMLAPLMGAGRTIWYLNLSICILLPGLVRINTDKGMKVALVVLIVLYCLIYSFYAYFGESPRGLTMLPYENIFNFNE